MLSGPRLVTASETEEGKRWAESRIKSITRGDPITARFMRQDFFTFKPVFKLLIVGNHMPALGSVDDAARRRFRLVPFENRPSIVDKQLETKLRAEWPGILRWMINGCLMWQENGLAAPSNVQEATNKYFSDQDTLQQWIDERCELEINSRSNTVLAFADWTAFATSAGEYIGTKTLLTQRLAKKGIPSVPAKIDGKLVRVYKNLKLKFSQSL
jgi:putative DNA primase/helicase